MLYWRKKRYDFFFSTPIPLSLLGDALLVLLLSTPLCPNGRIKQSKIAHVVHVSHCDLWYTLFMILCCALYKSPLWHWLSDDNETNRLHWTEEALSNNRFFSCSNRPDDPLHTFNATKPLYHRHTFSITRFVIAQSTKKHIFFLIEKTEQIRNFMNLAISFNQDKLFSFWW